MMKIAITIFRTDEGISNGELRKIVREIGDKFGASEDPGEGETANYVIDGWDVSLSWESGS